jgi:hypothetical protein
MSWSVDIILSPTSVSAKTVPIEKRGTASALALSSVFIFAGWLLARNKHQELASLRFDPGTETFNPTLDPSSLHPNSTSRTSGW